MKKILLVEPQFPTKTKSKNHKNFLPIGLLKLASYYKSKNHVVELVRGNKLPEKFENPDQIDITSLFTYWSEYVWTAIKFFRKEYPEAEIRVGGIYASLHYDEKVFKENCRKYDVKPVKGVQKEVEKFFPAYEEIINDENPLDYQIVHSSRGCHRKCPFCGTYKIEPKFIGEESILHKIEPGLNEELGLRNLVFYDNNLFYNPHIKNILNELIELKRQKKIGWCESQSGYDGRLLVKNPELAVLLKKAGFKNPRIAWDWKYDTYPEIEKQIKVMTDAGYNSKDIYIFMIYNWDWDFEEMEKKRQKCWEWKVQIADCRNRPFSQLSEKYKPLKDQQDTGEYYIHPNWTDYEVKQFRKNVRRQNICLRLGRDYHSKLLENKKNFTKEEYRKFNEMTRKDLVKQLNDAWFPDLISWPSCITGIKFGEEKSVYCLTYLNLFKSQEKIKIPIEVVF